jgi:wyosine [tRNA(Phe)-imidazoG37] synthetase (radical SAM superfamily)
MVHLTPDSLITGPKATERWGRAVFIDIGADGTTLAVSRENRLPRASVVVTLAAQELMRLSKGGEKAEHIVVIGSDVDPTHHPDFREISDNLRELRNKWFPRGKLVLISNDPELDLPETRIALGSYDFNVMRLESGTTKTYTALTGKKSTHLGQLVKHLTTVERVVVRAEIGRGEIDNSTPTEIKNWLRKLREVEPVEIQLSTVKVRKNSGSTRRSVSKSVLDKVAEELGDEVGTTVNIYAPGAELEPV